MPDKDGKLTKEEKQKTIDWIEERKLGEGPHCPVCGTNHWQIADHLVAPSIHTGEGLLLGGPAYPHVMVICRKCSNTLFLNAVMMGIL